MAPRDSISASIITGSVWLARIGRHRQHRSRGFPPRQAVRHAFHRARSLRRSGACCELGIRLVDLDTVFRESDFVTVNCPLTQETRHLVDARRLALMKPAAFLINCARGPVIDQRALTKVCRNAGLPVPAWTSSTLSRLTLTTPFSNSTNVIVTPHALCWTDQMFERIGATDMQAVLDLS